MHFSIVTVWTTYVGLPVSVFISGLLILTGVSHTDIKAEIKHLPIHILYGVIAAIIGVIGQVFLNLSMLYEDASKVAIVKSIDVFFTFALQYIVLNIPLEIYSIIGSMFILAGTFLVLLFKLLSDNNYKNKMNFNEEKVNKNRRKNVVKQCIYLRF